MEDRAVSLSSGGQELGRWAPGEYRIDHMGDGVYTITAENESLEFVPNRPDLFAVGVVNGEVEVIDRTPPEEPTPAEAEPAEAPSEREAPAPRPITRAAFYTLAGTTAALGLWALLRILFA